MLLKLNVNTVQQTFMTERQLDDLVKNLKFNRFQAKGLFLLSRMRSKSISLICVLLTIFDICQQNWAAPPITVQLTRVIS